MGAFDQSPRTAFYPSLVATLELRFDEGLTVLTPGPKTQAELAKSGARPSPQVEEPLIFAKGADNFSHKIAIVPRSASVELPGYRQAGKFEISFAYSDLPLDPRVLRGCGISIHIGAVPAADFADGMTASTIPLGRKPGAGRASILKPTPENQVLRGIVDSIDVEHDDKGAVVRLEGRDLRGIFLDTTVAAQTLKDIDPKSKIHTICSILVNQVAPLGGGIAVTINPLDWPGGEAPSPGDKFTRVNMDAAGKAPKTPVKGDVNSLKIWDVVTQYCFLVGAIPHFVGQVLKIAPAISLFDLRAAEDDGVPKTMDFEENAPPPLPFADGKSRSLTSPVVDKPETFKFRRMVFGRDILKFKLERKLGGVKVPAVRCICIDTENKTKGTNPDTGLPNNVLVAEFPKPSTSKESKAARTTTVGAGGEVQETEILTIPIHGIKDIEQLSLIAESLREEIGRQELGGSCSTKNLASFGGDNSDPDLLRLRPGDPVEFRADASGLGTFPPPISELTNHEGRSFEEEVAAVKKKLPDEAGSENFARVLVATARGTISQLARTFRVGTVKYSWDSDSGLALDFDFQNYVELRYKVPGALDFNTQTEVKI